MLVFQTQLGAESSVQGRRDFGRPYSHYGVLATRVTGALYASATACKAWCSCVGKSLPRFSARRRIPAHAVELKKYRCGIEPFSSTSDKDDTAASLGQGEKLGVEDAPRHCSFGSKHATSVLPPSPWCDKLTSFSGKSAKKAAKGSGFVAKESRDVFVNKDNWWPTMLFPYGVSVIDELDIYEGDVAACIGQAIAKAGHRERLTWWAADNHVDFCEHTFRPVAEFGHVAEVRYIWVMVGEDGARKWFNFSKADRFPSKRLERHTRSFDTRAEAEEFHACLPRYSSAFAKNFSSSTGCR